MTDLEQEIYDLSTRLWYKLAPDSVRGGGHPGVSGPADGEIYCHEEALLEGARTQLKAALALAFANSPTLKAL